MGIKCTETCYIDGFYYEAGREYDLDLPKDHGHRQYFEFPDQGSKAEKTKGKAEKIKEEPKTLAALTETPGADDPKTLADATARQPG